MAYGVLPLFGLANAGMSLAGLSVDAVFAPVPVGIAAGLFIGKQVGVMVTSWLAVQRGWAAWPEGATLVQMYGVAVLCGIGFTMSLFIGSLAFPSDNFQNQVKLGVFSGSALAAIVGFLVLRCAGRPTSA